MSVKISARARYSLRILLDLALHGASGPRAVKDIAKSQQISEKFISLLVVKLHRSSFLTTIRGIHGGLVLNKTPRNIRLLDIVEAMDGPVSLLDCLKGPQKCPRQSHCVVRNVWDAVNQKLIDALSEVNLQDILDQYAQTAKSAGDPDYCI